MSRARTYLRLGRVSNLPTVWSNVLAGTALAGAVPGAATAVALCLALSLFYVAGMFLNDAFDREIDARERPERPIPSGLVGAGEVFGAGFGLLAAGTLAVAFVGFGRAVFAALALAAAIVVYDRWHKGHALAPLVMGLCRALVYATAALAVSGTLAPAVVAGAVVLLAYVVGLSLVARREGQGRPLFGRTLGPRTVAALIAGISLLDAGVIALAGHPGLAAIAAIGFPATLALQRWVRGT